LQLLLYIVGIKITGELIADKRASSRFKACIQGD